MGLSTKTSALGAAQYHAGPAVAASAAQYALDLHQHMRRGPCAGPARVRAGRDRNDWPGRAVDAGVNAPGFPTATSRLDSLKLQAVYKLQDKLSVTATYAYEELRSADWRADGVMPNTIANLLTFGDQASHYRVNLIRLGMRYQF